MLAVFVASAGRFYTFTDATTQSPMDPEIQQALKIALGSAFIGFGIATTLYGITCLQIYLYYRNHAKDPFGVKLMVAILWVLDTLGTIGIAHTLYFYLVPNIGNPDVDFVIPWITFLQELRGFDHSNNAMVFFAWQILKVGKNAFISSIIVILSIAAWALDIVVVVSMFRDNSGLTLATPVALITGTSVQGIDALCDIIITASFIYYLRSFRNGVKPTEKIIDNLILYAVSRGFLTVYVLYSDVLHWVRRNTEHMYLFIIRVTQIVFVSLDAGLPGQLFWLPFQQAVGKLYVNSVLASLNSRRSSENKPTSVVHFTETVSRGTTLRTTPGHTQSSGTVHPMSFTPNADAAKSMFNTESYMMCTTIGGESDGKDSPGSQRGMGIGTVTNTSDIQIEKPHGLDMPLSIGHAV
ncbi:hypothetical protein ACEPAI_2479 [Sanghuangporus weigelae]